MANSMEVSQKTKNRTTIWPSNSIPGYISKNMNLKRYMHPNVHISIIYNCQGMEASVHQQINIKKMWYIYVCVCVCVYRKILLSHKKEWNFAIYNNMEGLGGYYAKWNKSDRERQIPYDIIKYCMVAQIGRASCRERV